MRDPIDIHLDVNGVPLEALFTQNMEYTEPTPAVRRWGCGAPMRSRSRPGIERTTVSL